MKKRIIYAVLVTVAVASISVVGYSYLLNGGGFPPINKNQHTSYDYREDATVTPGQYRDVVFNDITGDYRPVYPELTDVQYEQFFGNLPEFKEDFFQIAELVYDGKITDYSRLSNNYWLQPEFYPGWFTSLNNTYIDNNPAMWTPEGYGCYPCIKEIVAPKGSDIEVNTYFKTGYATEAYQGLVIKPYLPESAVSLIGNTLFEQDMNVNSYLSVSIGNPDNALYETFKSRIVYSNVEPEDWFVVLKPTYQLLQDKYGAIIGESGFPSDWVHVLQLNIDISSDTPIGDYVVAINVVPPCFEINQEFYFSTEHEYYGALYHASGGFHRTNIPHFQVVLHVT